MHDAETAIKPFCETRQSPAMNFRIVAHAKIIGGGNRKVFVTAVRKPCGFRYVLFQNPLELGRARRLSHFAPNGGA